MCGAGGGTSRNTHRNKLSLFVVIVLLEKLRDEFKMFKKRSMTKKSHIDIVVLSCCHDLLSGS